MSSTDALTPAYPAEESYLSCKETILEKRSHSQQASSTHWSDSLCQAVRISSKRRLRRIRRESNIRYEGKGDKSLCHSFTEHGQPSLYQHCFKATKRGRMGGMRSALSCEDNVATGHLLSSSTCVADPDCVHNCQSHLQCSLGCGELPSPSQRWGSHRHGTDKKEEDNTKICVCTGCDDASGACGSKIVLSYSDPHACDRDVTLISVARPSSATEGSIFIRRAKGFSPLQISPTRKTVSNEDEDLSAPQISTGLPSLVLPVAGVTCDRIMELIGPKWSPLSQSKQYPAAPASIQMSRSQGAGRPPHTALCQGHSPCDPLPITLGARSSGAKNENESRRDRNDRHIGRGDDQNRRTSAHSRSSGRRLRSRGMDLSLCMVVLPLLLRMVVCDLPSSAAPLSQANKTHSLDKRADSPSLTPNTARPRGSSKNGNSSSAHDYVHHLKSMLGQGLGFHLTERHETPSVGDQILIGYLTGSQQPQHGPYRAPGQVISGALTYAVEQINDDPSILPNHTLNFTIAETYGLALESLRKTALLLDEGVHVYIGPQETCVHEARLAAAFNLPMISYFCSEAGVSDKLMYPTFARTKPTDWQVSESLVATLKMFNWTKITFIQSSKAEFTHMADTICQVLSRHNITVLFRKRYDGPYFHGHQNNLFINIVDETRMDSRIYVMLGAFYDFVGLMDHLQDTGLLDSGDYFVVGVFSGQYDPRDPQKVMKGIFNQDVTNRSALAFRHFLGVMHSPPVFPEYDDFRATVNAYLEAPPFHYSNPFKAIDGRKHISPEAAYLYDAVWLYARAAHEMLREGLDIRNGKAVIDKVIGMTYRSAMGYMSRINSMGDNEGNFSLFARAPVPGSRRPDGQVEWGLYPVGVFQLSSNLTSLPTLKLCPGCSLQWINGRPPLDEPLCGFRYERCIPSKTYTREIVGGVVGGILLVAVIAGYLIYRNWRYEQDLASLLWKIDLRDLKFAQHPGQPHSHSSHHRSRTPVPQLEDTAKSDAVQAEGCLPSSIAINGDTTSLETARS